MAILTCKDIRKSASEIKPAIEGYAAQALASLEELLKRFPDPKNRNKPMPLFDSPGEFARAAESIEADDNLIALDRHAEEAPF